MRGLWRVLLVVVPLLAAGCADAPEPRAPALAPPPVELPSSLALGLGADGALSTAASAAPESVVPLRWGWAQWLDGTLAPAWTSEPAIEPYIVLNATATMVHTATQPVQTMAQRPEFTVWFGVGDSVVDHGFRDGPATLLPGDRAVATYELLVPRGGLVVEAGERLVLRVGSYYADDASRGAVAVVLGGAEGSRLDVVAVPLPPATGSFEHQALHDETIELMGGRCMGLDPATEADMRWVPIDLDALDWTPRVIDVRVERTGGDGPPDVDFVLLDDAGEVVVHGAGSGGDEQAHLRGPNVEGAKGVWQLGAYACTAQRSTANVSYALRG